jgi:hypothetical protein
LTTSNSSDELAWGEEDRVGDADLPYVVERCGSFDWLEHAARHPHRSSDEECGPADPPCVLARVIVPELGGQGEPLEGLDLRLLELVGSDLHPLFQRLVLNPELLVQEPNLEHVPDPEQDLVEVEWLGQEVLRPGCQGPSPCLGGRVCGEDEDGQVRVPRGQRLQQLHHFESVHVRHQQIEEDQVRLAFGDQTGDLARLRGARDVAVPSVRQRPLQEPDVGFLVIHDQDPGFSR